MYLPENELHEMGLLFYTYIVRKAGHEVMYLGQATPVNALADVVERWHPDILITGAMTGLSFMKPADYLGKDQRPVQRQKNTGIRCAGLGSQSRKICSYDNVFAVTLRSRTEKTHSKTRGPWQNC